MAKGSRIVVTRGALGCGCPNGSLEQALKGRIDAIVADGGSMHAGSLLRGPEAQWYRAAAGWRARDLEWRPEVAGKVFAELDGEMSEAL